jgi:hypothetical protein
MRCNTRLVAAIIVFSICGFVSYPVDAGPPVAGARTTASDLPTVKLVELARAAKARFQPLPADHAAKAKAQLRQAIQRLELALRRGSSKNAQRWKEYLQWDQMMAELAKSEGPDVRQLSGIAAKYYQDHGSLELPVFTQVRDDLAAYLAALATAGDSRLAENYQGQLDALIEKLPQYDANPTTESRQQIGQLLGWLENAGQSSSLVAAVRQRNWKPNLYAEISERLVSQGMGEAVSEETDVRDCILGTSIFGRAAMCGRTHVRLIDHPDTANVQVVLTGSVRSTNVGYNRGVRIFSRGVTDVEAIKPVYLDPIGFTTGQSTAVCATDSVIDDIVAKRGMVERIAWKRAARSKTEAEQIGSEHAEERIATRMDERAEETLAEARESYENKFRRPLLRRGEFPQDMKFRTQRGFLKVVWRQASSVQLAAQSVPPSIAGQHDAAVRVHESMVSNFSRAMIGGVTLTDKKLVEILQKNKGEVPEALRLSDDKEPWSITFAANDPVNAVFSDNTIRFAIRGRRFQLGERTVSNTLELSAVYTMEKTPEGARLVRQGDVSVDYIDLRRKPSPEQIIVRTVMREKFEALFVPEFNTKGITLPGRWENAGKLHLEHIAAQNGWLSLAWLQTVGLPADSRPADSRPADSRLVQSN